MVRDGAIIFGPKTLGFGPLGGGIVGPQSQYLGSSPISMCMHMHTSVLPRAHIYAHSVHILLAPLLLSCTVAGSSTGGIMSGH